MKNKVISFLLAIVLVALFLFLALPSAHQQALDSKEKLYTHRLDSLNKAITALQIQADHLAEKVEIARDSAKQARQIAFKWQKRYEDVKNTPITRYSDPQLDSVLAVLYPR